MQLHWLNYWMMFHTLMFWTLVLTSFLKIEALVQVPWDTIIQLWIWNLFAYLYVAFVNYLRIMKKRNDELELVL
jgi:dolichyl-phosphate-mannose--protein O-mannosyl transferase